MLLMYKSEFGAEREREREAGMKGSERAATDANAVAQQSLPPEFILDPESVHLTWITVFLFLYLLPNTVIVYLSGTYFLQQLLLGRWFAIQPLCIFSLLWLMHRPIGARAYLTGMSMDFRNRLVALTIFLLCMGSVGINLAFIVINSRYANSDACKTDPYSLCQGHYSTFYCILGMVAFQLLLALFSVVCTFMWLHGGKSLWNKKQHGRPFHLLGAAKGAEGGGDRRR